jgi:penicillin V acylase-like amidase (Ntn superfamily)
MLALVGTKYEKPSPRKMNVFMGVFCLWAMQSFSSVTELYDSMDDIRIWGPKIVAEHFVLRDKSGTSLVIELIDGEKHVYLDHNDGASGVGIMTNEPAFDWHLTNIEHYEWKRTLARQAVEVPGGWYPEDRFLRVYMVKQGMQEMGLLQDTHDIQTALSLTVQVLNTVTVPMGNQYGTDTGESGGEGSGSDHTMFAVIRDHSDPAIYW